MYLTISHPFHTAGSGFSGFFYHQGYFSSRNVTDESFYCFSSGCLSLLLSRTDLDTVFECTNSIQDDLRTGRLSAYHVVERFVNQTIAYETCPYDGADCSAAARWIHDLLPNLNILITTWNDGVKVLKPSTFDELAEYLLQTTYIPYFTGPGQLLKIENEHVLDGGFSRMLHPKCDRSVPVPMTLDNLLHSLNPLMSKDTARRLWKQGYEASFRA